AGSDDAGSIAVRSGVAARQHAVQAHRSPPHRPGTFRTSHPYSWPVSRAAAYGASVKRVIVGFGLAAPPLVLLLLLLDLGGAVSSTAGPLPLPVGLLI